MTVREESEGLAQVAPGLWAVVHHRSTAVLHAQLRMGVVRLPSGGLLLYSPVPIDEELATALGELGPVEHILAPSRFHHLFAGPVKARYPSAVLWGAPGLAAKRPDLRFDEELPPAEASPFGPDVEVVCLEGHRTAECVLYHRSSRSLLCCDFFFNVKDEPSLLGRTLFRALGVLGRPGQSRVFRLLTRDKPAARASVEEVLGWDLDRVVVAHGEVLEQGAAEHLRRACAWLVGTAPPG